MAMAPIAHAVQVTQELENQYEHRLATELERYDRLAEEMEAMRQRCEGLLEAQVQQPLVSLVQGS